MKCPKFNKYWLLICFIMFITGCNSNTITKTDKNVINATKQTSDAMYPTNAPSYSLKTEDSTIISKYSTEVLDFDENRINNINIALNQINGTILQPEQVFSFNDILGQRTTEKGYKKAIIIYEGKRDYGTGGGICQISSTIYNTALLGQLEIVERHPHTKKVPYIEEGKDATIVYGLLDLKFKNNKPFPIQLKTRLINGYIYATLRRV